MVKEVQLPQRFQDTSGKEWIVTRRIPGHNIPMRTLIDAETAGEDRPESHMVPESYIVETISTLKARKQEQPVTLVPSAALR